MKRLGLLLAIAMSVMLAKPAMATVQEMTFKAVTGASSATGQNCEGAVKIQLTAVDGKTQAGHSGDTAFDGTVDVQFCPNTTVCPNTSTGWQTAVTGITLGTTYTFHDSGRWRFYVNYGTVGSVVGTVDAWDTHGVRTK